MFFKVFGYVIFFIVNRNFGIGYDVYNLIVYSFESYWVGFVVCEIGIVYDFLYIFYKFLEVFVVII